MLHRTSRVAVFIAYAFLSLKLTCGQLIRPVQVYESLIKDVHDYFNNTCIILLHATTNPIEGQGLEESNGLIELQTYFSARLKIRTSMMDFQMFKERVGQSYHHIKRPLFVLLNDRESVRREFALLSREIAMSYPTWLVFSEKETDVDEFLSEVYVPFDCLVLICQKESEKGKAEMIRDFYRIDREEELRSAKFGRWEPGTGLQATQLGLYQRRNDLYGLNLRIGSLHNPPKSVIRRNDQGEIVGLGGVFGEMMDLLKQGMNCTVTYKESTIFGARLNNGEWTGLVGMLVNKEIDLVANELSVNADRLEVMKFSTPVYNSKWRIYIKRPETKAVKWDAYTAPFDAQIWCSIGLLILMTSGFITIIETILRGGFVSIYSIYLEDSSSRFSETIFYVLGAFSGQGMQPSLFDPIRLIHLTIHTTAVVLLAAYSAALISFLAVKTFVLPFTTMEGLLQHEEYRFSVTGNSSAYTIFQNATDKLLSELSKKLFKEEMDLPRNELDGFNRVCHEKTYSFLTLDNTAKSVENSIDCTLVPLDVLMQATLALGLPMDSPYRGIINANLLLLRDSGILQRLLTSTVSMDFKQNADVWTSVEIEDVLPLFLLMLITVAITGLIFFLEHAAHRKLASPVEIKKPQRKLDAVRGKKCRNTNSAGNDHRASRIDQGNTEKSKKTSKFYVP